MARVLIIIPPAPFLAFPNAAPHLGVGYLISHLRSNGVQVEFENWESALPSEVEVPEGYDYYAITAVTPQYHFAKLILENILNRSLGKTIIGGAHASMVPQSCLADGFDYVVTGYGEAALLSIVSGEVSSGIVNGIPLNDIDSLASPSWDDLKKFEYNASYGNNTAHMLTMRGCPYKCNYCCSPSIYGNSVTYRNSKIISDEISFLINNHNIDSIQFMDPCFTINKYRVKYISEILARHKLNWTCQTRVDLIDESTLKVMHKSGCDQISFGIETGSSSVFSLLNKDTTIEQSANAIKIAHQVGMRVKGYFMGCLPTDTEKSFNETKEFVLANKPDSWLYSTFIPFPGTILWERPEKFGIRIVNKDFRLYYPLGLNGRGPVNIESIYLTREKLVELRDDMIDFLRNEIPNRRVDNAIALFEHQKEQILPYFDGLDWKYIA